MQIYLLVACDRLEDAQEAQLKTNLPALQSALQTYAETHADKGVSLINECDSEYCEDWLLGISQGAKKSIHLKFPVNLFNDLAKQYDIDCEVGTMENNKREPVSYFGKEEGKGDSFLIAQYMGL
ncbi:hypothetical protein NBRC116188_17570 [Oceaniserpentilla sp. 4NH20-0058]|uniref:hypothetical protein n=1 Tax=Oceaniserpentilla sp. 4NH20-0058 TaxID=3127660 RepID=UPI00310B7E5D